MRPHAGPPGGMPVGTISSHIGNTWAGSTLEETVGDQISSYTDLLVPSSTMQHAASDWKEP